MSTTPNDVDHFIARWSPSGAAERAEDERRGHIRWLRPEFQCRATGTSGTQTEAFLETDAERSAGFQPMTPTTTPEKRPWPDTMAAQAVREVLAQLNRPATPQEIAKTFHRARKQRIAGAVPDGRKRAVFRSFRSFPSCTLVITHIYSAL